MIYQDFLLIFFIFLINTAGVTFLYFCLVNFFLLKLILYLIALPLPFWLIIFYLISTYLLLDFISLSSFYQRVFEVFNNFDLWVGFLSRDFLLIYQILYSLIKFINIFQSLFCYTAVNYPIFFWCLFWIKK